ncbi:MAG: Ig-like domain-containing protein [Planctomycetales bacterium]|nr:Ig-like domain-containing protein [Planctomycetales bacterium]
MDKVSGTSHCGVCHYAFTGGGPRNPYGLAVEGTANRNAAEILALGPLDSDADGYTNNVEITDRTLYVNTPTFPGLTASNVNQVTGVVIANIRDHLTPHTGADTTPPTVTVNSPDGGQTLTANTSTAIQWTAEDTGGIAVVKIYLSTDSGATFAMIASGLSNTGTYTWFPANRPTTVALIRVEATDNSFNTAHDDSNQVFAIISPPGGRVPTTLRDFDMPGTQPFEAGTLNNPSNCAACHGDYDPSVEPYYNWQGSMMAQASFDPLFKANMVIANQDAPDSGDLCLRCHLSAGWMQGRSVPTDGSAMLEADEIGVACDLCHRMVDPIYTAGVSPVEDAAILAALVSPTTEFGLGMFTVDPAGSARRGPFVNAATGHPVIVSPFHQEAAFCGTCHDVSNPAFEKNEQGSYAPNTLGAPATDFASTKLLPVERTYSEWLHSAYSNTPGGIYAPEFGGNKAFVATCQDCHMRDITGQGCNMNPPVRTDLPLHDMTGGSTWLPTLLPAMHPGKVNAAALNSGVTRARYMLQNAALMTASQVDETLKVTVTNNTGHKLPTGYPEGRRIWLNVRFYDRSMNLLKESAVYDPNTGVLDAHDTEAKVYDIEPAIDSTISSITGLPEGHSFHFVLNSTVAKDNRIPPRGFTNTAFAAFGGSPVAYSYPDGQYWDDTLYAIPEGAATAQATLYYQSTSKEFIEFLQGENTTNSAGDEMYNLWNSNSKCPPEVMEQTQIQLTVAADLNRDYEVNFDDLAQLCANWLSENCTQPDDCGRADLVDDGRVDLQDFEAFAEYWIWP